MRKHVTLEKMSKKARMELARVVRGSWGGISPVTRVSPNPKVYNRKKTRREDNDFSAGL